MEDTPLVEGWLVPREHPRLADGEAHVWRISLAEPDVMARLEPLLTGPESLRARSFVFEQDRGLFIVAHGALRLLLGRYLRSDPHRVDLTVDDDRKPRLADPLAHARIRFNLSHSGEEVVVAVSGGREVGVDIEAVRAKVVTDALAAASFAPRELGAWRATPEEERTATFFSCWTRKEAYLKARGAGLAVPLDSFEVSLSRAPGHLPTLTSPDSARWALRALPPIDGYAGALVVERPCTGLLFWMLHV